MADVHMSLSFNNQQEIFIFPVLPEQIDIGDGQNSKTYTTEGLGEINVIKSPKLTTFKFESEFPSQAYPYVNQPQFLMRPIEYLTYIKKWMATKRPVRFIYAGTTFKINEAVSIEAFDWKEVAGTGGDIEFSIILKKYEFYAAQRVTVTTDKNGQTVLRKEPPKRPNERQVPATYKLGPGENLWIVAKKWLDDGSRYKEIQKLNGLTDADLKKLPVGLVLKLPQS
ncbi:LysM peptidoglycan-binding domain-containing protein [Brevibacillus brevis]|uniref:LysM peptidoglycan-binding domain-containing protein n=1 Tax=Brevibacillus brevis TaxID=1393 RepID=UPI0031B804B5